MADSAILFDSSKCIACRACQVACKQWWELPSVPTINRGTYENPPDLQPGTWNRILFQEISVNDTVRWQFTRKACMHCTAAVCVWVCPSYARTYGSQGYVTVNQERCIGCGRCVNYCPFTVPRLGRYDLTPRIPVEAGSPKNISYKCAFCKDRVEDGLSPACVKTCPTGALQFGLRTGIVEKGRARVDALKMTYPVANLYGEKELVGLHVLYVLTNEPSVHGFPVNPQVGNYPQFDEKGFPDWYKEALAEGTFPVFPPDARREWYMQPWLEPKPRPSEPVWPAASASSGIGWGVPALLGWFGFGLIGSGAALWWTIRRKMTQEKDKRIDSAATEEDGAK